MLNFTDDSRGLAALYTCAQPDQAIYQDANHEIDDDSAINGKTLMTQRVRQIRHQREVIDGIAEKDGNQVFKPSAGSDSEKLARHLSISCLGQQAF